MYILNISNIYAACISISDVTFQMILVYLNNILVLLWGTPMVKDCAIVLRKVKLKKNKNELIVHDCT